MSNLQINTRVRRLFQYLEDFERGKIQVPPFQRDFVWANDKKLDLMDSLKNGFPIGSVLFWQPEVDTLDIVDEEIQSIGSYHLSVRTYDSFFILDGYQRLSTLFGCFIDPSSTMLHRNERQWKRNFDIVYNLREDKFEFNRKTRSELQIYQVPLYHFVTSEKFYDFQTELTQANIDDDEKREFIMRYKSFGSKISSYDIPSIDLLGGTIKEAVDIFSRLNSRGERITDDWKVSALSFSRERNFRFGSEIDKLFDRVKRFNFFTSSGDRKSKRELILQCVITAFGKVYFDVPNASKQLEGLALQRNFIDVCLEVMVSIERAIKFLFEELLILDSKLLPYNNQLIFITEFFYRIQHPSRNQLDKLKEWFWITTYSNYFTIYNLSKQRLAFEYFNRFIENESFDPVYYDKYDFFETIEFPKKITMNSVRAKALALFMLNYSLNEDDILFGPPINSIENFNYSTIRLFTDIGKDEENSSENTMLVIKENHTMRIMDRRETGWEILTRRYINNERYFVSDEMLREFASDAIIPNFLLKRLELIKVKEQQFVESLHMRYEE
jgi:uncharacterized protein with ParB-like and HNH nuclease domain